MVGFKDFVPEEISPRDSCRSYGCDCLPERKEPLAQRRSMNWFRHTYQRCRSIRFLVAQ